MPSSLYSDGPSIFDWLGAVENPALRSCKRKRKDSLTQRDANMSSTPVRMRPDSDETPRAPGLRPNNPFAFPTVGSAIDSASSSSVTTTSTTSNKRKRSQSPRKVDLYMVRDRVECEDFPQPGLDETKLPPDLERIVSKILNEYSIGIGIIDETLRDEERDADGQPTATSKLLDILRTTPNAFSPRCSLPGPSPSPEECVRILYCARRCETDKASEAHWNSHVHNQVLQAALWHTRASVCWVNCTTAKIEPERLLLRLVDNSTILPKMVDFALSVEPTPAMTKGIHKRKTESASQPWYINHTAYGPLRRGPIGVSIETKRTGEEFSETLVKLQIWCAAQFARMEEMVAERDFLRTTGVLGDLGTVLDSTALFLPAIIVQGHDWSFVAAVRDAEAKSMVCACYSFHAIVTS